MAEQKPVTPTPAPQNEATASASAAPVPQQSEKPWLFGQTPSMWFLIDTAVVLLIVLIMRFV